jgi:hypothetical protein
MRGSRTSKRITSYGDRPISWPKTLSTIKRPMTLGEIGSLPKQSAITVTTASTNAKADEMISTRLSVIGPGFTAWF